MKLSLVIFAAGILLVCQAAKVPEEKTHQVTVPVPSSILAAPTTSSKEPLKTEIPAKVVAKDAGEPSVTTTVQPAAKTKIPLKLEITTAVNEVKRKTRALPYTDAGKIKVPDSQRHTVAKPQSNHSGHKMSSSNRSKRDVVTAQTTTAAADVTVQPTVFTENPVIKSSVPSSTKSPINPCDLLCTKFEFEPICATNGLCLHEFPNQCILETFNCKHPVSKFSATKDGRCQMDWLNKCDESEMI